MIGLRSVVKCKLRLSEHIDKLIETPQPKIGLMV